MKFNSIVFKMITPLVVVTIFVVIGTLFATQNYLKKVVEDIFINLQVHHFEEVYRLKIDNILSNIKRDGIAIASSYDVQKFIISDDAKNRKMPKPMQKELHELKELYKLDVIYMTEINNRNYYNENGFVKVVNPLDEESQWYLRTLENKKRFYINADSDITGTLHIWVDTIVGDIDHPLGLAGGGVDVSDLLNIALREIDDKSANALIIDKKNIIKSASQKIIKTEQSFTNADLPKSKVSAILEAMQNKYYLAKYKLGADTRFVVIIPIDEIGWTVLVDFSRTEFLQHLSGIYDRIITGGAILLFLLIFVGGSVFTYLISRPLKRISDAVSEFDYKTDFNPQGCRNMGYEVDMICDAFNKSSIMLRKTVDRYKYNEELLKSIVNAADDIIFYKDTRHVYLGGNNAYEKWSSKSMDQIIGKTDEDLYPIDIANSHMQTDRYVIEQNRTVIVEEKFEKDDGSSVILQVKKSPFYDKDKNIIGLVVVARDMTKLKDMENALRTLNSTLEKRVEDKTKELQQSNEMLEEHIIDLEILNSRLARTRREALQAAQARSNFITGISHELRTPLNAIINFTDQVIEDFDEMLTDKELQKDSKVFLQRVIVNSRHLLQLINDLLEFTKAEAGKMDYKIEANDLNAIARLAYNNTYSLLNGTEVKFNLLLNTEPFMAMVDSRRFLQILLNLLSNAIKFTKRGFIELRSFEEDGYILVEVKDSGKGIPLDKQKAIFEPFVQVNNTDNGTGLGLGLVKRMCDDMQVEISLTSVEGEGTVFRLMLKKIK